MTTFFEKTYAFLAEFGILSAEVRWFIVICLSVFLIIFGIMEVLKKDAVEQINNNNLKGYDSQYIPDELDDYYLSPVKLDNDSPIKSKTIAITIFLAVIFIVLFAYINKYFAERYKPYAAVVGSLSLIDFFHIIF
ncbi:hypothetical protein BMW23_0262 [Bodo saltans virus]|uniref:Uncharacterized protein n=1 Tax=Bodo saltans virus TaxID=2024608 RepID=A0A2H4UTQ2_9VIRU|nr:hypothetical protein QJ851_gp0257 [Bodo saltans virus]ATZ80320.1 hypothetical protein BMW23_0262 [Bodo saltans virus]